MKFDDLSNEEIAFIYLITEDMLDAFNEVIEKEGVSCIAYSSLGKFQVFKPFSKEDLEELKNSTKVKLLMSVAKKFAPVMELIQGSNQQLVDEVRDALFPKEEEDGSEEEDL